MVETIEPKTTADSRARRHPARSCARATRRSRSCACRAPTSAGGRCRWKSSTRVLGGGVVPGSLVLMGGDPGIGKSTLLLQVAARLATSAEPVLYVSAEESAQQIKLRADRLGLHCRRPVLLSETDLDAVLAHVSRDEAGPA